MKVLSYESQASPHQWILLTSLILSLALHSAEGATIASSHLRHRQRGVGSSKRDDLDPSGANATYDDITTPSPPQTTTPYRMREYSVRQHQETTLPCVLNANHTSSHSFDRFNLGWLHDDEMVEVVRAPTKSYSAAGAHRYTLDPESGALRISNARLREDEGVWQCVDRDPQTRIILAAARPVRVFVLEPPRSLYLVIDGRRLDPGNLFLPVKEDTELSVVCIVEGGHPAPAVAWVLTPMADEYITLNSSMPDETGEHEHVSSEARLGRVQRAHHNATITCVVSHETLANALNASLLLDVQYSPSFGISRVPGFGFPVHEGMAISLRCDVDSNPPSSPVWVKDDGPPPVAQSGDGFLNFSSIRREHSGWYKCTSRHLLGEFSSIGYFLNIRYDPGEVTQDPGPGESTDVQVALGGAVQLQCPSGVLGCWNRVGTQGMLEPVGPGPELTLDRVLYQEAGDYRCVAGKRDIFPRHWRENHQVKVTVTGRPVVYLSNKTLSATTGQQLNLAVEFCANPPVSRALWMTASRLIAPGTQQDNVVAHQVTNGSSTYCHQAVLSVRHVTPADGGEYVFVVRSPRGLAEAAVNVNVTRASGYSVSASDNVVAVAAHVIAVAVIAVVALAQTQIVDS